MQMSFFEASHNLAGRSSCNLLILNNMFLPHEFIGTSSTSNGIRSGTLMWYDSEESSSGTGTHVSDTLAAGRVEW